MDQFNQLLRQTGEYGIVYQVEAIRSFFIEGLPTVLKHRKFILFETGTKS